MHATNPRKSAIVGELWISELKALECSESGSRPASEERNFLQMPMDPKLKCEVRARRALRRWGGEDSR